jgi:hypothetical protein
MIACPICRQPLKAGRCACPEQPITVCPGNPDGSLDFVPCSDWLGEAEAALTHARNALLKAPEWQANWTTQKEIAIAIRCLETAIASEPRPSPSQ